MHAANVTFPSSLAGKAGAAMLTRVGLPSRVRVHMVLKVFHHDETLATYCAYVRP